MALADLLGGDEPLVRLRRRHPDVDHGDVGPMHRHVAEEILGVAGLRHDVEPRFVEQPRDAFAQEYRVVGENDADGDRAGPGPEGGEVATEPRIVELKDPLGLGQLGQRPESEVAQLATRA